MYKKPYIPSIIKLSQLLDNASMPRNIEIKARVDSIDALVALATAMGCDGPVKIPQDDTFFRCESGRLKLRTFSDGTGELIFYRRENDEGPKESHYVRAPSPAPDQLREALSLAYGQIGRVLKNRTLFVAGRTRIHLDNVAELGYFLELEVVLVDDEPAENGVREARELMTKLGIEPHQLIRGAYIDLLSKRLTEGCGGFQGGEGMPREGR
jgi:predicted adenylyl cyclase CyaB